MTRVILLTIVAALPMCGQPAAQAPAFEVADIKPSSGKDVAAGKERLLPGGRIELPHGTLKEMMVGAYGVQANMITGGPKWIETDRFDIVAKAPGPNTPVPTLLLMLRTLIEERFKLVMHREEKMMPAYSLTVAKDGPKLHQTAATGGRQNCRTTPTPERTLRRECTNITIAEFARQLGLGGYDIEGQVVDETGLTGAWDFAFDYVPQFRGRGPEGANPERPAAADAPSGPTIFQGMNQLGLKLEAAKRPLSVIVIDHAEKPAAN